MTRSRQKPIVPTAFIVAFVASTITGCSPDFATEEESTAPSGSPSASTPEGAKPTQAFDLFIDEYRASTEYLAESLPEGAVFPSAPPGEWESDGVFEEGVGDMQAALFWQCSWIAEYEKSKIADDAAAKAMALDQLDGWTELAAVAPNVDAESVTIWHRDVVGAAQDGDDSFLIMLADGCTGED